LFAEFLKKHGTEEKAEFYIPAAVNEIVRTRLARVRMLRTPDRWFGVTYRQDLAFVSEGIRRSVAG